MTGPELGHRLWPLNSITPGLSLSSDNKESICYYMLLSYSQNFIVESRFSRYISKFAAGKGSVSGTKLLIKMFLLTHKWQMMLCGYSLGDTSQHLLIWNCWLIKETITLTELMHVLVFFTGALKMASLQEKCWLKGGCITEKPSAVWGMIISRALSPTYR